MTWLRNAWWRLWTWVASWGRPVVETPKPQFDADAQDLISLARIVKEENWRVLEDPRATNRITPEQYRKMLDEQMRETESVPAGIYRSGSFGVAKKQFEEGVAANGVPKRMPLTLKVEK